MASAHRAQTDHEVSVAIGKTSVNGFLSSLGVSNFLGVPFATIGRRFGPAELLQPASIPGNLVDAKGYAPRCPQAVNFGRLRRLHLYDGVDDPSLAATSELECLTLNIYTPSTAFPPKQSNLPVLVWVHGGGWVFGDGNSEYDGNFMVEYSAHIKKPFIFVSLNYRLGYLGFLHSQELISEAKRKGESYRPNKGLYDQRVGLEWVRDNIHHFGGDASDVTVAGQSAGGWSALAHTLGDAKLCHRGLIMSSTVISFPSDDECQSIFDDLVSRTGTPPSASAQEKVAALENVSVEDIYNWQDGAVMVRPAWDPDWFATLHSPKRLDEVSAFPDWIEDLIIGCTKDETVNVRPPWSALDLPDIHAAIDSILPEGDIRNDIISAYDLHSTEKAAVLTGLVNLTTDAFFGLFPPKLGALSTPPICVFRFDQPDSFPDSHFPGSAYHCLDPPFLNRLPAVAGPQASKELRATANALSEAVAGFVSGELPWEPYHREGAMMVFNGMETGTVKSGRDERWRRFASSEERLAGLIDVSRLVMTYKFGARKK